MDISHFLNTAHQDTARTQEIMRIIEMAGWKDDPRILRQIALSQRTGDWEPIFELLRQRFGNAVGLHSFEIPSPADVAGDIPLCYLIWADWKVGPAVGIGLDSIYTHLEIVGPTGAGKSVLSRLAIIQLHNNFGIPVWVFDTEDQLKNVIAYCEQGSFWVVDVSKGQFKHNPWRPLPDETFDDVDARMRDVLKQKWIGEAGTGIESEVAHELYAERGRFTMRQFHERLKKRLARTRNWTEQNYIARLLNRIADINLQLGQSYEVMEGYPLEEMMTRSIVFRMGNMSADNVFFFVVELLSAVSDIRRQERSDYPGLVIMLDEAQRFFKPAERSGTAVYPLMLDHVQTFRKRRLALVLATQDPFDVPRAVSTNVATSIYFRPLDGDSNEKISRSLMLSPEQSKQLQELPKRHAVMRHVGSAKAFIVRVPELNIEHPVSEEQIAELMQPILATLKWTPSPYATTTAPHETVSEGHKEHDAASHDADHMVRNGDEGVQPSIEKQIKNEDSYLDVELLDYLRAVARDMLAPATVQSDNLKLSRGAGSRIRKTLVDKGLAERVVIPTGTSGGQIVLLDITKAGRELLARHHIRVNVPRGKGGLKHAYFQNAVQRWFAANFPNGTANIEDTDNDARKAVDVAFVGDGKKIAVEILVNGVDKEISNVEADLEFDEIWMVAEGKDQLDRLQQKVQSAFPHHMSRIQFHLITRFMSETKNNGK